MEDEGEIEEYLRKQRLERGLTPRQKRLVNALKKLLFSKRKKGGG